MDNRHKEIGGRRRAEARYALMLQRTTNTDNDRNICYSGVMVLVSKEDFVAWFMAGDFSGCSVDRIDKTKHYSLDNMQLIPLADNIRKDKLKAVDGFCECHICWKEKPIAEFCKDSRRQNGHSTTCLSCEAERGRQKRLRLKS